jgi:4-hydroxy-tetrahydrodipicolinate synthase
MLAYSRDEAKDYAKEKLRGVYSAFCLPDTPDHEVDEAGLRHDVRHLTDVIGSHGLYLHGFYGNFWLLTVEERKRVMEIVVDEAGGRVPIICRCAHQCLKDALELVRHAEATGADFVSLIGPAYASGTESMVYEYFEHIASQTNIGISVFNTPQAGYVISPEMMAKLADIPNVCALKNGVEMEHTAQVRALVGDRIMVVDPYEENFLVNIVEHGQRVIYTGTNYMFDSGRATPMHDYVEAALAGDLEQTTTLYEQMQPIRDLHQTWVLDPWRRNRLCPVSTIKFWGAQLGLTGGSVRPPLPAFPEPSAEQLRSEMQRVGLVD